MRQDTRVQRVAYALNIVAFPAARCLLSVLLDYHLSCRSDSALPLWLRYSPGNHLCSRMPRCTGLLTLSTVPSFSLFSAARCLLSVLLDYHLRCRSDSALPLWLRYSPGNHLCSRTPRCTGLLTLSTVPSFSLFSAARCLLSVLLDYNS
jgi:hypothetical protein